MAWIRTIPRSDAEGTLKDAYDWQAKRLGAPTEYTRLGSLYPELGMDRRLLERVSADPRTARTGDARLDAIMEYAVKLTLTPGRIDEADVDRLRAQNLADLDILDLNNMVAYYCYTNRVADGLGLKSTIDTAREATLAVPV